MSELSLFEGAHTIRLSASERARSLEQLHAFCAAHPVKESLLSAEKNDLRLALGAFASLNEQRRFAFSEQNSPPLPLWFGANLFGRLEPFCV